MERRKIYEFGPFHLDCAERLLLRNGEVIPLTPKVLGTLLILLENSGKLVGKEELMKAVWPDTFVEEGNLSYNISILRKTLGESPNGHPYIQTIPKSGYRFAVAVGELPDKNAASAVITPIPKWRRKRWSLAAACSFVAIVALSLFLAFNGSNRPGVTITSLVVLPIKNGSGDVQDEYLSDGITDELTTRLARLGLVRVISPSVAARFKHSPKATAVIGRQLGADVALEGSVRRARTRLRLSLDLISVRDGSQIWAEVFDSDLRDLLRTQRSAAEAVATRLARPLTKRDRELVTKQSTANVDAYESLLRGKIHFAQAGGEYVHRPETQAERELARQMFERAAALDREFADAYAWLSLVLYHQFHDGDASRKALDTAIVDAQHALVLDPASIIARRSLIHIYHSTGQTEEGLRQAKAVLSADSEDADALEAAAQAYFRAGMLERAVPLFQKAVDRDPANAPNRTELARSYLFRGEYQKGIDALSPLLAQNLGGEWIAMQLYTELGQYERAIQTGSRLREKSPDDPLGWLFLGRAFRLAGRTEEARKTWIAGAQYLEGKASTFDNERTRIFLSHIYAELGARHKALEHLRRGMALAPNDPWVLYRACVTEGMLGDEKQTVELLKQAVSHGFLAIHYINWDLASGHPLYGLRGNSDFQAVRVALETRVTHLKAEN